MNGEGEKCMEMRCEGDGDGHDVESRRGMDDTVEGGSKDVRLK